MTTAAAPGQTIRASAQLEELRARLELIAATRSHRHPATLLVRGDTLAAGEVTHVDFSGELAERVLDDVMSFVAAAAAKEFIEYDPSYQTSAGVVMVESLAAIGPLARLDAEIRAGDVPLDSRREQADHGPVLALAHMVGEPGSRVVAYRVKGPGIATRRPRGIVLLPRDGVYEAVGSEILVYEPRFHVLTVAGFAIVAQASMITARLEAPEKAQQLARATLETATARVAIEGRDALAAAVVDDPTMRAKMAAVSRVLEGDPEYARFLTTDRLLAFIDANPEYDIATTIDAAGNRALAFDPASQRRFQIPKLLADDFLRSELTSRRYEAGSKHQII